jgi:hypothetical protein
MKELVAGFLFSALRSLFQNQPDLSKFTSQTNKREPNLSFHLANELWPYMFWLDCDFDVTKRNLENRRPDIIFHRRGVHALNFLVVEVKRKDNPRGTSDDLTKIKRDWFGRHLAYRFGASVLIDEMNKTFVADLRENKVGDLPLALQKGDGQCGRGKPASNARNEIKAMAQHIAEAERDRNDTSQLKLTLDKLVLQFYGLNPFDQRITPENRDSETP